MDNDEIKKFYSHHPDEIINKRFRSPYALRRYAHMKQYESVLGFVVSGMRVLDAGCGEGVLSIMMAKKGAIVTGCDLSSPNIEKCKLYAKESGVSDKLEFLVGDAEQLPFADNSFDLVVSSHVLEHLPDFNRGLSEIMRVTKKRAVVAIPTVCNLCSLVQVGRGWFYLKGLRSFISLPIGFLKAVLALILGKEGVNESYGGNKAAPHIFRFPWVLKKKSVKYGFRVVAYEAATICAPFFESFLPIIRFLDKFKNKRVLRNFGYGTTYLIEK